MVTTNSKNLKNGNIDFKLSVTLASQRSIDHLVAWEFFSGPRYHRYGSQIRIYIYVLLTCHKGIKTRPQLIPRASFSSPVSHCCL